MIFVSLFFDAILIGLLLAGIAYAMKLTRQLADMRASRGEMERFVLEFNATVSRAEAGVRGLKAASRQTGDDLEKLLEKGQMLRDELSFLIDSADQMASRLAGQATSAAKASAPGESAAAAEPAAPRRAAQAAAPSPVSAAAPSSAAERDLLRALQKRG